LHASDYAGGGDDDDRIDFDEDDYFDDYHNDYDYANGAHVHR
jgi:hypothetical protein